MKPEPNYTLKAFLEPLHLVALVLLLGVALASALVPVGGVVVLEILYLALVPRMVPYRRRVNLQAGQNQLEDRASRRELKAANLSREVRQNYQTLVRTYEGIKRQEAQLPVGISQVEDLMDAALEVSLALEALSRAERDQPFAQLEAAAANGDPTARGRLMARVEDREAAGQLQAKLGEIEGGLGQMLRLTQGNVLGTPQLGELKSEMEIQARTAREMASLSLKD